MNYGIRYDNFGNAYPIGQTQLANFHLGTGTSLQSRMTNGFMQPQGHVYSNAMNWVFSPRAGVAYDPFGDGKWVIRGGIGLFHDFVTLGNSENGLKGNPPGFVIPTFKNDGSTAPPIFGYGTQNKYPYGFPYPAFVRNTARFQRWRRRLEYQCGWCGCEHVFASNAQLVSNG